VQNNAYQEVTLFKDYYLAPGLLSTVKTTNKLLHVLSSIFAEENNFDNALILNTDKKVVEVSNGNLFLVTKANEIVTAPLSDGCINGVFRKQLLEVASKNTDIKVVERSISPFELQKANELFVTNVIRGITPILKYKKKTFETTWSTKLTEMINNTYQTQYPL